MSPRHSRSRTSVLFGVIGLVLAGLLMAFVVQYASDTDNDVNLGDEVFDAGPAASLARSIDRDGPLAFLDPLRRGRDIWLEHLGDRRFVAFEAVLPDDCRLDLDRSRRRLRNSCTKAFVDGDVPEAVHYRVTLDEGDDPHVFVDLRARL